VLAQGEATAKTIEGLNPRNISCGIMVEFR